SAGNSLKMRRTTAGEPELKSRASTSRWVTLQRVPPDMRILRPTLGCALSSVTRAPASAARNAAASPAAPAPITMTCFAPTRRHATRSARAPRTSRPAHVRKRRFAVKRRMTWMAAALVLSATSAHAGGWSIGSNLGVSVLQPKGGGDNLLAIGLPGSVGQIVPGFQPGLRFGFPVGGGENEVYFDAGLSMLNASGETLTGYQFSANLQHNFVAKGSSSPYFTFGGGFMGQ